MGLHIRSLCKLTNSDCQTFSISFSPAELDEGIYRQDFKSKHSLELAEFPGKILPLEFYQNNCQQLFIWPDFPNSSLANFYLASGKSAGVDLLLSGFGGDHLFSGKKSFTYLSAINGYHAGEHTAPIGLPVIYQFLEGNSLSLSMRKLSPDRRRSDCCQLAL